MKTDGDDVGTAEGKLVGAFEGKTDGAGVGTSEGKLVGTLEGSCVGYCETEGERVEIVVGK